jgi:hypothetical protein
MKQLCRMAPPILPSLFAILAHSLPEENIRLGTEYGADYSGG